MINIQKMKEKNICFRLGFIEIIFSVFFAKYTRWIESLNTVMDDNKILTLASNERIALTPTMRLLFEISNLRTATPATVKHFPFKINISTIAITYNIECECTNKMFKMIFSFFV